MNYSLSFIIFVLLYCTLLFRILTEATDISDNIRKCCNLGRTQASKLNTCDIAYTVTDIAPVWRGLCHSTYGLCCTYDLEKKHCALGRNAALTGASCYVNAKNTTVAYTNCCRGCQLGLAVNVSGRSCNDPLFEYFISMESFLTCCNASETQTVREYQIRNDVYSDKTLAYEEKDLNELNGAIVLSNDDDDICGKIRLCEQICVNTKESYRCKCYPGYKLSSNMITCELAISISLNDSDDESETQNSNGQLLDDIAPCPKKTLDIYLAKCHDIDECIRNCKDSEFCLDEIYYHCLNGYKKIEEEHQTNHCIKGFELKNGHCVDINECENEEEPVCDSNQLCVNDIGDFHCVCKVGFTLDSTINACVDINECSVNNHNCLESQRCDNTYGSYVCTRTVACGTGYTLNADSGLCTDNDECALGTHNCKEGYKCHNTKGSFRCYRISTTTTTTSTTTTKPTITKATSTPRPTSYAHYYQYRHGVTNPSHLEYTSHQMSNHSFQSEYNDLPPCEVGFHRNHLRACVDINECHTSHPPCGSHQRCINTNGSYRCENLLKCSAGFISNPEGTQCLDIDECSTGEHNCLDGQICTNKRGSFMCTCLPGYEVQKSSDGTPRCMDINECSRTYPNQMLCPSNAKCINTQGSYFCECKSGFQKSVEENSKTQSRLCLDVDECNDIPGLCQQKCLNFFGGYRCTCLAGYELAADNRTCNDVNECTVQRSYQLCMGYCNNVPGSYECSCPRGYVLASDRFTCLDIDECSDGTVCTGHHDVCTNVRGSYKCSTIVCPPGYIHIADQKTRCQLAKPCENDECYTKPLTYTHNFISLVSNLMIPPEGRIIFNLRGPSYYDIDFNDLKIVRTVSPANIEKATYKHFSTTKDKHEIHLSLKRSLEGPQEIELELGMTVFTRGLPRGQSVAKIYILVSQYSF